MAVSKVSLFVVLVASVTFVLDAFNGKAQAQVTDPLPSDPARINWDMSGTSCAVWAADKTLDLRRRYSWAAIGKDLPCGSCLKATSMASGASLVVRVVDKSDGGPQVEMSVLQKIGSVLAYEFPEDCQDNGSN